MERGEGTGGLELSLVLALVHRDTKTTERREGTMRERQREEESERYQQVPVLDKRICTGYRPPKCEARQPKRKKSHGNNRKNRLSHSYSSNRVASNTVRTATGPASANGGCT